MVWVAVWYKIAVVFGRVIKGVLFRHKRATVFPRRGITFGAMKTALPRKTVVVAGTKTEASLLFAGRKNSPRWKPARTQADGNIPNTSSLLPIQDEKRNTSSLNTLHEIGGARLTREDGNRPRKFISEGNIRG
jgi:hypothetical protein